MNVRDRLQERAVKSFGGDGILELAPRTGKTKVAIDIFKREGCKRILIAYPENVIKDSWVSEFKKWGYTPEDVTFTSFDSLHKYVGEKYDLVVIDEIHASSPKNLQTMRKLKKGNVFLGLSGTMTWKTKDEIWSALRITPCYSYSIEEAVIDGILSDYQIDIVKVPLDNQHKIFSKGRTEQQHFDALKWVYEHKEQPFHVELRMQGIIKNTQSKIERTKELLERFKDERVLVFCGLTSICDALGIPSYHSKNGNRKLFEDFCKGEGDKIALCNIGGLGTTITPIQKCIVNYSSGNPEDTAQKICRIIGYEWDNPEKKAHIVVLCSDVSFQKERIDTGLGFFNKDKINWYGNDY